MVGFLSSGGLKLIEYVEYTFSIFIFIASNIFFSGKNVEIYPGSIIYAQRDIGKLSGLSYASAVAPILSSLAISLASLNSISND